MILLSVHTQDSHQPLSKTPPKVIGACTFKRHESQLIEIVLFAIQEGYKGNGAGQALLSTAIRYSLIDG